MSFNSTLLRTCRSFHDYLRPGLYDYINLSEGDANEQLADCLLAIFNHDPGALKIKSLNFWTIDWRENLTALLNRFLDVLRRHPQITEHVTYFSFDMKVLVGRILALLP